MVHDDAAINVLVIEDDAALRELLVEIVSSRGHDVVAAASAEAGLEQLPVRTFQVALLDHQLPGLEGLVLGEYLRRNNPDMAIALITGTVDARVQSKSRDHGIVFVPKPFVTKDILRIIDDYVEDARERDELRRQHEDADFEPPLARFAAELSAAFELPGVPPRIEDRIALVVKRSLSDLRSVGRYTERGRVIALSGLLAARVLGLGLPRTPAGRTLFEEYDDIMKVRGRRTEFEPQPEATAGPTDRSDRRTP